MTTTSTTHCIHGFPTEHCVSCRTCDHGQLASACPKCRAVTTVRKVPEPTGDLSTHEHAGHEIFYDPAVSGWRYRTSDETTSPLSYRSAFLARKAVDAREQAGDEATAPARGKGRKG